MLFLSRITQFGALVYVGQKQIGPTYILIGLFPNVVFQSRYRIDGTCSEHNIHRNCRVDLIGRFVASRLQASMLSYPSHELCPVAVVAYIIAKVYINLR